MAKRATAQKAPARRPAAKSQFEVVRLEGRRKVVAPSLSATEKDWQKGQECFLFVGAHDDDIIMSGALAILSALAEGVPVHVAIATDGSMGYCDLAIMEQISQIRRVETYASYQMLGLSTKQIHWLGFPDCRLSLYQGRRHAMGDERPQSFGHTGLQHAFTELLRSVRPTRLFMPTAADLHPDHRFVYQEMMISMFHAAGSIWPELGAPLAAPPVLYELAVYCDFPAPPTHRITVAPEIFKKKVDAIKAFQSQAQIGSLIKVLEEAGPQELLRRWEFVPYNSARYNPMFGPSRIKAAKPAKKAGKGRR
jgi:LmbE family N-acetylglucosaminyl deacetylase